MAAAAQVPLPESPVAASPVPPLNLGAMSNAPRPQARQHIARFHAAESAAGNPSAVSGASADTATSTPVPARTPSPRNPTGAAARPAQGEPRRSPRIRDATVLMMRAYHPEDSEYSEVSSGQQAPSTQQLQQALVQARQMAVTASDLAQMLRVPQDELLELVRGLDPFWHELPPHVASHLRRVRNACEQAADGQYLLRQGLRAFVCAFNHHDYELQPRQPGRRIIGINDGDPWVIACTVCGDEQHVHGSEQDIVRRLDVRLPDHPQFQRLRQLRAGQQQRADAQGLQAAPVDEGQSQGTLDSGEATMSVDPNPPARIAMMRAANPREGSASVRATVLAPVLHGVEQVDGCSGPVA